MVRTPLIAILFSALAASAVAQTPATPVPAPPAPGQEYVQLTFIHAAGTKCGWLTQLQQKALEISIRERLAALGALGDADEVIAAYLAGRETEQRGKALSCDGAQAVTGAAQSKASADRLAGIWAARAHAVAIFPAPWAVNLTTVGAQKAALDAEAAKAASTPLKARAQADAERALMMICGERRTTRSASPRACPAVPPGDRSFTAYARAWVEGAEGFAETLASPGAGQIAVAVLDAPAAPRPLNLSAPQTTGRGPTPEGPPPPPPPPLPPSILAAGDQMTNYFKWTSSTADLTMDAPVCAKGDLVIKPDRSALGGSTLTAPLGRLGEQVTLGQVSVRSGRTGVQYLSLEPDAAARSAGIAAGGVFKQCPG